MSVSATKEVCKQVKSHLRKFLNVTNLGDLHTYIGLTIERDRQNRTIYVSQADYVEKILKLSSMESCNPVSTLMLKEYATKCISTAPLDAPGKKQYQ